MNLEQHVLESIAAIQGLGEQLDHTEIIGREIGKRLDAGRRLLVAGNGGSAAEAQHLTAELVGRYRKDRRALSAIALHAETSALTAVANDYGYNEVFARQVDAHGRSGDIFVGISTSGSSPNVLAGMERAEAIGLWTIAITGQRSNPLAVVAHDAIAVNATSVPAIQEAHLVVVHLLCEAIDGALNAKETSVSLTMSSTNRSSKTTSRLDYGFAGNSR